jgi:ribosomal protein S18 acetylase RimI-like enzyme
VSAGDSTELLSGREALPEAEAVWRCYAAVFDDFNDAETWRAELFERHARRHGYRLAVARDADGMVGFAWGYVGEKGQYWTDLVAAALPHEVVSAWVGGHFELVELAVLRTHRGRGLGRRLLAGVLDGVARRCLLSTVDDERDPAVRLYRSEGWDRLGSLRPGVQVMGLDLRGASARTADVRRETDCGSGDVG